MAALIVGHCWCSKRGTPCHEFTIRNRHSTRILVPLCCQGRRPVSNNSNPEEKKDNMGGGKLGLLKWKVLLNGFEKLGKRPPQQNLSPQQKGDWKDLLLMSISFAVYVYISQKLVCAYFAWTFMPKPVW